MEDALIESREVKDLVVLDGAAQGGAELVLPVRIFFAHERMRGGYAAIPQVIEQAAMCDVRPTLGHYIDHRTASAAKLRAIRIRRNTELLHYFIAEVVWSAVTPRSLREETIVVVC